MRLADTLRFRGPSPIDRLTARLSRGREEAFPLVLHRRRIYILPTRFGVFFSALLMVMLLASLNYNNNLSLLLTFLLGGMLLMATLGTYRNLAGTRIESCSASPVFAGEAATVRLVVTNPGGQRRCMLRARLDGNERAFDMDPHDTSEPTLKLATRRRGWQAVPRIRLYTLFPVGFFHAWSWLNRPGRVLVYPAPETDAPPLPLNASRATGEPGMSGDEFAGLREYRTGDPLRLIAWKALARTEELISKEFHTPGRGRLWFDFSTLGGLSTEARLARLTRWVLVAHARHRAYGLKLPGRVIPPGSGERHYRQCLRTLALFEHP